MLTRWNPLLNLTTVGLAALDGVLTYLTGPHPEPRPEHGGPWAHVDDIPL